MTHSTHSPAELSIDEQPWPEAARLAALEAELRALRGEEPQP